MKLINKIFFKTIFIFLIIILLINIDINVLTKNRTSCSQKQSSSFSDERTVQSASYEITEIPRSDYTDALIFWFQIHKPIPFENPFTGEELGKAI